MDSKYTTGHFVPTIIGRKEIRQNNAQEFLMHVFTNLVLKSANMNLHYCISVV